MEKRFDIVVIGAGPAGAAAALEARRLGLGSVLLIERSSWPRPKPCGGGISPKARKALTEMGLWPRVNALAYPIRGLRLVSPNGREVVLAGAETASVLNRAELDAILVDAAVGAGAVFEHGARVESLVMADGRVEGVRADGREIEARWVVAADGSRGRFGTDDRPRTALATAIATYEGVSLTQNIVEMIFDPEIAPHYGWLFPESPSRANIGICVETDKLRGRSVRELFDRFVERYYRRRLAHADPVNGVKGQPIVTCASIAHRAPEGVLLAGEAARLSNRATGEGISYALLSGRLAARAIARGIRGAASAGEVARAYERSLRWEIGPGLFAADLFCRHGTGVLNTVAALGGTPLARRLSGKAMARL
jgi:geranylgeranyl reductase family protein